MKEYYLFLDESKPNKEVEHFCLGGCVIEKENYIKNVMPYIKNLKINIFETSDIILHETEIRRAKGQYSVMRDKQKREKFWNAMKKLFDKYDITVLSSIITPNKCKNIYNSKYLNDEYFICLQIILENFTYFLETHNGKGSIYLESRNSTEDNKVQNHFFNLMSNGTLFLNKNALQAHLTTISFPLKQDNNIGLQIADFIPNVLKKKAFNLKQKTPSIQGNILNCLYTGDSEEAKQRFGMKIIP